MELFTVYYKAPKICFFQLWLVKFWIKTLYFSLPYFFSKWLLMELFFPAIHTPASHIISLIDGVPNQNYVKETPSVTQHCDVGIVHNNLACFLWANRRTPQASNHEVVSKKGKMSTTMFWSAHVVSMYWNV